MTKPKKSKTEVTAPAEEITSYKGFDANLKCRDYQYEVGGEYEHAGPVAACKGGFHACEHPLNVFDYYAPAGNRFAVVKQSGNLSRHDDTKVASRKIKIVAEIGIPGPVKAAIEYTVSRCLPVDEKSPASATGHRGAASATGHQGAASATGKASVAISTGRYGKAKAAAGCAIVLVFRNDEGEIIHIRASKVGENGIKPDTCYTLSEAGEFVEVQP